MLLLRPRRSKGREKEEGKNEELTNTTPTENLTCDEELLLYSVHLPSAIALPRDTPDHLMLVIFKLSPYSIIRRDGLGLPQGIIVIIASRLNLQCRSSLPSSRMTECPCRRLEFDHVIAESRPHHWRKNFFSGRQKFHRSGSSTPAHTTSQYFSSLLNCYGLSIKVNH